MRAVAKQPVSVAINADSVSFRFYSKGVFNGPCSEDLNHGVVVVGYGIERVGDGLSHHSNSQPCPIKGDAFWLVKNSWGEEFGDGGYIKIARAHGKDDSEDVPGKCGILLAASFPEIK